MNSVSLGGDRLKSGNKLKVGLKEFERSTFDLGYTWRSTMSAGTLVPFLCEVALPGDTWDIDLNVDVLTHPTIGPLFGSYKIQVDLFKIPIRLYNAKLHMNMIGIGMDMSKILLPQMTLRGKSPSVQKSSVDNVQVNPSCIFSYLNIRGLGYKGTDEVKRNFNAVPYLAYWDIYKNYYANKMEEEGALIHRIDDVGYINFTDVAFNQVYVDGVLTATVPIAESPNYVADKSFRVNDGSLMVLDYSGPNVTKLTSPIQLLCRKDYETLWTWVDIYDIFDQVILLTTQNTITGGYMKAEYANQLFHVSSVYQKGLDPNDTGDVPIQITRFPLSNIDDMRKDILSKAHDVNAYVVDENSIAPYNLPLLNISSEVRDYPIKYSQEGLALKTYDSDLFNNWLSTDWLSGTNGIQEITAVQITDNQFTIDELNLSKKVYDMLMRIAVTGGTYDDWLDAVYSHERYKSTENPIYQGGLIKTLVFQEVVSNSASGDQPLGTLAGRGKVIGEGKGGKSIIKIDEPSYIMGIVSLTPRLDYSQGNKWDVNLKSLNDVHKPSLDQIGFQPLITDQLAWFDTELDADGNPTFKSAGKQPAWLNYMTNVNQVRGNFADENSQMYMVLNRRYEPIPVFGDIKIKDLTTYVDPAKFNHIFADTRLDAQNFWTQVGVGMIVRRKMSSKLMPNL